MPWKHPVARDRIQKLLDEVPEMDVQRFDQYWLRYQIDKALQTAMKQPTTPPLFSLPRDKAVVVDTVQIYISIVGYDEMRLDDGRETEASHARALKGLHLYYGAADRVIEETNAQRVDFHSGRMHAVFLETGSGGVSRETIGQALALAEDFKRVVKLANDRLANGEFGTEFRVGIDVGTCVAINNGTGSEQEPMFLGSAANHAAKLAEGDTPGVYVSDRVRAVLGYQEVGLLEKYLELNSSQISANSAYTSDDGSVLFGVTNRQAFSDRIVDTWSDDVRKRIVDDLTSPDFKFSFKQPPLSEIDYSELYPSKSIRMPLVSLFADISGYTNFIDEAVSEGNIQVAVRALFVIRQEFQNVAENDFGGRKVRFIGDCIHALVAEGSGTSTDEVRSVATATQCAAGFHASFDLCKSMLDGIESLELAVGLELGTTPVSRIGIRGERSVRVASSKATSESEKMQRECNEGGVKIGPDALRVAPKGLIDILGDQGYAREVDYDDVSASILATPTELAQPLYARAHVPAEPSKPRAHLAKK
ncbi:adenylate/guanylate cyclase domain-containing protein [uncultured Roseobacter sp.]|uniref:adenylate/guanylate cyclase domain-containing protein n=1 Tax=uncultured Roseobacter sp. TaxID=114847 RepID=UPI00260D8832|nr:adenylate/guanylate cyclase domain-containing protein [uncultured Roseobacter sp.]